MEDFFLFFIMPIILTFTIISGVVLITNYDTKETKKINEARCATVAFDAGSNQYHTNYYGECTYINKDGKLQTVKVN